MITLSTILAASMAFLVIIQTPAEIQQGWEDLGYRGEVGGYSTWAYKSDPPVDCTIFVPPLTWSTMHIWNHELRHCKEGHWHPK